MEPLPSAPLFPPPAVEENEARYCFFLPPVAVHQTDDQALAAAEQQCAAFLALAEQQTRGFLWHKHRFHLQVTAAHRPLADEAGSGRYYLSGRTSVGDAIQDEWVVAALVFELTRQFPGVVARLADSDGEFLLIESAEALPDWVTPDASDRRVFVERGELHIAPPADSEATGISGKHEELFDEDALRLVQDPATSTKASKAVQQLIQRKLGEVPAYLRENRHRVRCLLPVKAARVLARQPALVGPAVEAFYYREPKHAGFVCSKMSTFMPANQKGEENEVVEQMVTFSRAMFAQLKQQEFFPPKPFFTRRDSPFRVLQVAQSDEENRHPDAQAADLGVKLTCGLELLRAGDSEDQLGRPWKQLIDDLLQQDVVLEPLRRPIEPDDDDSWLYVHPDTLESQLQRAAMAGAAGNGPGGADELQNMAAMFGKFVDGVSGVDGVEGAEPVQFDMSSFMDILNDHGSSGGKAAGLDAPWGQHYMDEDEPSDSDSDDEAEEEGVDGEDLALEQAMAEMEAELAGTKVAESFARFEELGEEEETSSAGGKATTAAVSSSSSAEKPLDLNYNLLSNLLESFASQEGHAGPVSTILNEMNFPPAAP
ncbi:hypothetical protein BBJ28_00000608 [Nothophytophthora sp. Chile5]|nr:hypothetical protein BBJ28_00000608 [Nothophytophthora sp. Chile5]